jgi:Domain of unknown function (DUF397)
MFTFGALARLVHAASPAGGPTGQDQSAVIDFACAEWRKSSWSAMNGNCVEVAELRSGDIGVRDSKNSSPGPVLAFDGAAWRSFIDGLKSGSLSFTGSD